MNKNDLISNISTKSGLTKRDVEAVLNSFLGEVTDALASGDKVQLIGFGTFELVRVPAARAATRKPARKSRFLNPRFLHSKPATN